MEFSTPEHCRVDSASQCAWIRKHLIYFYVDNQASSWNSSRVDDSRTTDRYDQEKPFELVIPGCPGFQCPLETFVYALSNRILYPPSRRNAACGIRRTSRTLRWQQYKLHDDDD